MATELDPLIVRALKLLHSRSKDALEQLRQMTDEAIAQRRAELAMKRLEDGGKIGDEGKSSYRGSHKRDHSEVEKKREAEKKSLDKLREDLLNVGDGAQPTKKPKLESPSSGTESKHSGREKESRDREKSRDHSKDSKKDEKERDSHKPTYKEDPSWLDSGHNFGPSKPKPKPEEPASDDHFLLGGANHGSDTSDDNEETGNFPDLDAEQFATDLMDLACVVCKQMDITSGNRLLDCQECHRLYHQECHKPPVDEDVDDPRFVWYCSKCSKTMKKMVKQQKPKSQSSSSKEKESSGQTHKVFKPESSLQQPFKRLDTSKASSAGKESSSHSASSSSSRPYTGLASLAANIKDSSKSSRGGPETNPKAPGSSHSKGDPSKGGLGFLFKPDAHKITKSSSTGSGLYKLGSGSSGKSPPSSVKSSSSSSSKQAGISLLAKTSSSGLSSGSKTSSQSQSSRSSTSTSGTTTVSRSGSFSSAAIAAHTSKSSSTPALPRSGSTSSTTPPIARSNSSSGSAAPTSGRPMSSLMSADRRVHMMKKKAAAKAAERKAMR